MKLGTAQLLVRKIQGLTGVRFAEGFHRWEFEHLYPSRWDLQNGGWRWRIRCRGELFGLEIGSHNRVNEVLTAHRLVVIPAVGQIEVVVEKPS